MIRLILIVSMLIPRFAQSQPTRGAVEPEILVVDGYEIPITELYPKKRIVLIEPLVCMGEYEYTLVEGFVADADITLSVEVSKAKSERDSICEESKAGIRAANTVVVNKLTTDWKLASERLVFTETALSETKSEHKVDLTHHYVIEGVLSVALLGVISTLIIR